ncbi:MAG: putative Flp pilus assembly protein TadC [Rhodospirillales bacterium]|nr:putative Flp pilus assembly protein TadC [Rhodospirillales bacterium]
MSIIDGDDVLALSSAATAVMALFAVWHGLIVRDPVGARLRGLSRIRLGLKADFSAPKRNRARSDIRRSGLSLMRLAVIRFNLMRGRQLEKIAARLARAGWRSQDALTAYLFAKAFVPVVTVGGGILLLGFKDRLSIGPNLTYLILGIAAVAGLFGTDMLVKNVGDKRIKKLTQALPDALDLLVICAEAGLSLESAVKRVGQEMGSASAEMSDEFMLTAVELNFLPDRTRALRNLVKRTDLPKLRALVNSLIQSERFGTPLANSLRVLSAEFRNERMMKAEEKAAKLPAIMTVPMILFILPTLFIIILGPVILHIIDTMHGK